MTDAEPNAGWEEVDGVSRRELLGRGAAIGLVMALPAAGTASVLLPSTADAAPAVLAPAQSAVLKAFVERLIPSDATGPGAAEAGVATFIERSLAGGLAGGLASVGPLYKAGLSAVDAYANSKYGAGFASLTAAQQDAVVADVASGKATGFTPNSTTFFGVIHEHTLEGMFSDPVYGGNKNFAGWDLLGYPGVRMPLPAKYQEFVKVPRVPNHSRSTYANGQFPQAKKEAVA
jgi:gluconate 2-dehydrogenase gamma chain